MRRHTWFLVFFLILCLPFICFSQEDTLVTHNHKSWAAHFLSISCGAFTPDFLMDGYLPGRPTEYNYANKGAPGALVIAYQYKFSRKSSIGITGTMEQQ